MNHYFIENPALLTQERQLFLDIFGMEFEFLTNNGLFSCNKIDEASKILLEQMPPITGDLLDLGCGYGVLGIVLSKKNKINLTMSDVNSLALDYAVKNAKLNQVIATAIHSDGFANITESYHHITLNPPIHAGKEVMYRLYEEATKHLHVGGSLYVVIQKKHGAESTKKKLLELFKDCHTLYKKKGVFVYQARNPFFTNAIQNSTINTKTFAHIITNDCQRGVSPPPVVK